jgi:hypothetical protein
MVGSFCFALGSLPLYFDHVDAEIVAWTFFVGSIFFTSAASLQFQQVFAVRPRSADWWAAAVQLVGTVFFNISTFAATRHGFSVEEEKRLIWAPDVYGSICFLIASWIAYVVLPRHWDFREQSKSWWIAALNMLGSVAFGVSAVAARYLSTTGEPANITLVNLGTFAGAVCFFVGAALLPFESDRDTAPQAAPA